MLRSYHHWQQTTFTTEGFRNIEESVPICSMRTLLLDTFILDTLLLDTSAVGALIWQKTVCGKNQSELRMLL